MVIGFVGAGKMARAIAKGIVGREVAAAAEIICSGPRPESTRLFSELLPGARTTHDNGAVVAASDLVILAIKPQMFPAVLPTLRAGTANKLIVSIAAGISLQQMAGWLDTTARIVRAMPNTPVQIGLGATVFAGANNVTDSDYSLLQTIFSATGLAWQVTEDQIDAVTALSGSGPAYVFQFLEALARGGVALGLAEDLAQELACQTVYGAAKLAATSSLSPLDLAAQVKSPGGTTLAGCAVLEENSALDELVARCMAAAKMRASELSRGT